MSWETIRLEGGLLTTDHLERIRAKDAQMPGIRPTDYDVAGNLDSKLSEAWRDLRNAWGGQFAIRRTNAKGDDEAYHVTVDSWLRYVFSSLGFAGFKPTPNHIGGEPKPVTWNNTVPFHVVAFTKSLEKGADGTARRNPHSVIQQHLNDGKAKWGIVTNGLTWRILRDNATHTRPAFIEFDLQAMMEGDRFDEFRFFWLLSHATRFTGETPILEQWMRESARFGVKARDALRDSVEGAIRALGEGFLQNTNNHALRGRLESGKLTQQDYFHQVLRLVYRLLFLFVTEERNLLLAPKPGQSKDDFAVATRIYRDYYSMRRLRDLAATVQGSRHEDMYEGLKVVMNGLKDADGCPQLALPPLNSDLWSPKFVPDLDAARLRNVSFLTALQHLSTVKDPRGKDRRVNYGNLDAEELGSVYESLLELEAEVDPKKMQFRLQAVHGSERRSTGSHYTPTDLVELTLNHALDPILDEAVKKPSPEHAILALTVCDPTCGSGHFLIAAAHRIARRLARIRTGEEEPAPEDLRHALRDVIGHCIYGVDINPMSVELCKVSLWLEAMEPGKPLAYLENRIKCGNALLGTFPEYLDKGVPEQAYTYREGIDDKAVCARLRKANAAIDIKSTTLNAYRDDIRKTEAKLAAALAEIDAMPTNTVPEVEAKDAAYRRRFLETDEYQRYRLALDAWCAAFTYSKTSSTSDGNITTAQILDLLNTEIEVLPDVYQLVMSERTQRKNNFFHWELEFPNVFGAGGFSAAVGNPPYMGGRNLGSELGRHYSQFFEAVFNGYLGKSDLAGASIRLFHRITHPEGRSGLVTTFAVSSGATRISGLGAVVKDGGISAAFTGIPWGGSANVVVSVVVLMRTLPQRRILNGEQVEYISSRLDKMPETETMPLAARQRRCFEGHKPAGSGFVVGLSEAKALLSRNPMNEQVLKPFLTATDLLQEPDQAPTRYAICFGDRELSQAQAFSDLMSIVEREVRPVRESATTEIWRTYWWRFGKYNEAIRPENIRSPQVIVRARHTETPLFLLVPKEILVGDTCSVFPTDDPQLLGVLNSGIHEVWYRKEGSGLKQDSRYTPRTCFETFPVERQSDRICLLGEQFHNQILSSSRHRGIALSPVWNLVNDSRCSDTDIAEIRRLRDELTVAVAHAFDMKGINFRFGFYRDSAGRERYAMHPEAAEQVYLALVALNAKQAISADGSRATIPGVVGGQATLAGSRTGQMRLTTR